MFKSTLTLLSLLLSAVMLLASTANAATNAGPATQNQEDAIWQEVNKAAEEGPRQIKLRDEAVIHLPAGYAFVPPPAADHLLQVMGNQVSKDFLGLIMPTGDEQGWFVTVRYMDSGYVRDGDAKDWKADTLLKNLKDGTESGNDFRKQHGIPPIEVVGWIEPPTYDPTTHRLVWSARVREKGEASSDHDGVNYNTYLLGREGYVSMDMVTDAASIDHFKPVAKTLLDDVDFNQGKRYADFHEGTDKVATYGIAALVGGLAAKKLGLIAVFGAFFLKAWKLIAVAFVAFGAKFRNLFKRKNS